MSLPPEQSIGLQLLRFLPGFNSLLVFLYKDPALWANQPLLACTQFILGAAVTMLNIYLGHYLAYLWNVHLWPLLSSAIQNPLHRLKASRNASSAFEAEVVSRPARDKKSPRKYLEIWYKRRKVAEAKLVDCKDCVLLFLRPGDFYHQRDKNRWLSSDTNTVTFRHETRTWEVSSELRDGVDANGKTKYDKTSCQDIMICVPRKGKRALCWSGDISSTKRRLFEADRVVAKSPHQEIDERQYNTSFASHRTQVRNVAAHTSASVGLAIHDRWVQDKNVLRVAIQEAIKQGLSLRDITKKVE